MNVLLQLFLDDIWLYKRFICISHNIWVIDAYFHSFLCTSVLWVFFLASFRDIIVRGDGVEEVRLHESFFDSWISKFILVGLYLVAKLILHLFNYWIDQNIRSSAFRGLKREICVIYVVLRLYLTQGHQSFLVVLMKNDVVDLILSVFTFFRLLHDRLLLLYIEVN